MAPAAGRVRRHVAELVRLGAPVVLSRAGNTLLLVLDVVMVGHAGTEQLAFQSIGFAISNTLQMVGLGLLVGTLVMTAAAVGRQEPQAGGAVGRRSSVSLMCCWPAWPPRGGCTCLRRGRRSPRRSPVTSSWSGSGISDASP